MRHGRKQNECIQKMTQTGMYPSCIVLVLTVCFCAVFLSYLFQLCLSEDVRRRVLSSCRVVSTAV